MSQLRQIVYHRQIDYQVPDGVDPATFRPGVDSLTGAIQTAVEDAIEQIGTTQTHIVSHSWFPVPGGLMLSLVLAYVDRSDEIVRAFTDARIN